ncbi:MAG: thermonuclease family protein [Halofilum sp. (in: g-proteobacteria)]
MFAWATAAVAATCPAARIDTRATVETVFDGDSVRLADGRSVRLVGINTPEIGRDGAPDEPLARSARQALIDLLGDDHSIGLEIAPEGTDRYDRVLAHVHTADGRNVTAALLEQGLGWHIAVPPNLGHLDCYRRAERLARREDRGVHGEAALAPIAAEELDADAGGFTLVTGTIERVGTSRRAYWLDLGGLTLRLTRADLPYFEETDPRRWHGRSLRARGWIYRVDGQARMNLGHPAAVEWMDTRQ